MIVVLAMLALLNADTGEIQLEPIELMSVKECIALSQEFVEAGDGSTAVFCAVVKDPSEMET